MVPHRTQVPQNLEVVDAGPLRLVVGARSFFVVGSRDAHTQNHHSHDGSNLDVRAKCADDES